MNAVDLYAELSCGERNVEPVIDEQGDFVFLVGTRDYLGGGATKLDLLLCVVFERI